MRKGRSLQSIVVGGIGDYNRFDLEPNNRNKNNVKIISPPMKLSVEPSSLLSYSAYIAHSILITNDGSFMGVGYNFDGRIYTSLEKRVIDHFTEFSIKDRSDHQLVPLSAVCCGYSTLYMLSKGKNNERKLVLCDCQIKGGDPIFLDISNNKRPVALFGGLYYSAAIGSDGEVIFINRNAIRNSPESRIESVSLPEGEKASFVAFCKNSVIVLSLTGRVFSSKFEDESNVLKFSSISELDGKEIICLSGTNEHCLAVSREGRVFGLGSNQYGQIGLGEERGSVSSFTEISSLSNYQIRAAYAGFSHSLFETSEGKIISCGFNEYGELLLSSGSGENVYFPVETTITEGAHFCIAGGNSSIVFIDCDPPKNTPNMKILEYK